MSATGQMSIPRSLRRFVIQWEDAAGYEATGKERIIDRKTLREVLQGNQRWLEEHCEEKCRLASRVVSKI